MSEAVTSPPSNVFTRYIDNPYGPEALALPYKDIFIGEHVDLGGLPKDDLALEDRNVKRSGQAFIEEQAIGDFNILHNLFCNTLVGLIGQEYFERSRIYFDNFYHELAANDVATYWVPHLDGTAPGGFNALASMFNGEDGRALKLIGFACNSVPTMTLQGPTKPQDYIGEAKTELRSSVADTLTKVEIPIDRLVLMPPSLPHYAQYATAPTLRHAVRWQVMIG